MTTVAVPGVVSLGLARGATELKEFFRQKENVVFTFSLPAVIMLLLGSVYVKMPVHGQMFAASVIGAGIISTSFVGLGISVAADREDGTLKRLRATPMPLASYFIGKTVMVLVAGFAEVVLLLAVAVLRFDVVLPADPVKWLTFAWVFVLGVLSCALLGIAVSSLAKSSRSAPAVLNLPYIVLQFISGVFIIPLTALPASLHTAGAIFPLKWVCQGFRSVFVADEYAVLEVAGSWELGRVALILAAWCAAGLVLTLKTFRWNNES